MITEEVFRKMALSLPGSEVTPHFERIGFKVVGKRMFATYLQKENTADIFLTSAEQAVFCQMDVKNIYPVPNKWGEKGATTFNLKEVPKEFVLEALLSAYNEVIKSKGSRTKK
jgi:predicted DNA-binding protein (MmcQ/YjbR family)